jgi:hypothetical protein
MRKKIKIIYYPPKDFTMTTEWMKKNITPSLVAKYEREMAKLRGEASHKEHVVENIKKLTEEVKKIETAEERHAKDLAEDAAEEKEYQERMKEKMKRNRNK